jgi:RNA polymerase sigma-70 factor (ECF subfamily)
MGSDQELVEKTLNGDLEVFDELMKRYERLVYKVAYGFVGDAESAFDVSQTVFLKAYKALAGFRKEANVKTWLMRITYNESINWVRRPSERSSVHEALDDTSFELTAEAPQERDLEQRESRRKISKAMEKLNERYRLAVVLRYFQGLGIAEISEVLGCSEGVTKNILFRSVKTMREAMTEGAS